MLPATPLKLGRYEILDEIGKGAMGVVYLARDPLIGRLVALKTFRVGYSVKDHEAEQFRVRFIREAQSAGILSHPGIVTIHDVVEQSDDGLAFIAMEYVRGNNLKLLLQGEAPLSLPFVADVVRQIAEALDYAHARGVVHRDVKPANIIITADDQVKITDFGIARLDTSNLTQEGQLLGTPNYMAPEQIQGREVDHRADIFSLGVVLYEMLTRHKPFQGENLTVVSHRIVYDEFTPPEQYVRGLPPEMRAILSRALEKDAAKRYPRARELAEDLRRAAAANGAAAAADDLNDTQSFVAVPPPLPPLSGQLAAQPAGAGDSALTTLRISPRRLGAMAGLAALATALVVTAAILGLGWRGAPVEESVRPDAKGEVLTLLSQGHQLMRQGKPAAAAAAYGRAARLAPDKPKIERLRAEAVAVARNFDQELRTQGTFQAQLSAGRRAVEEKQWDIADAFAGAALGLEPTSEEARELRAAAQAGRARQAREARKPPPGLRPVAQLPEALPGSAVAPAEEAAPAPAVPADAILQIVLHSLLPEGVLVIYQDHPEGRKQILREEFRFYEKKRLFRPRGGKGSLEKSVRLRPGTANLLIYVTTPNKPGRPINFSENLAAGSTRRLALRLSESGEVQLE